MEEDGGYIADIPDLEACSAFGATPEEALAELKEARRAWLEAARASGKPVPRPRYRPVIYQHGIPLEEYSCGGVGGRVHGA